MSYNTVDATFKLSLEESGVLTTCEINVVYSDDFDEIQGGLLSAFRSSQEEASMIVKSDVLKDGIQELFEITSATSVRLAVTAGDHGGLGVSTEGTHICEVDLPLSSEAFVSFKCNETCCWNYSLGSFHLGMKALAVAFETYIRVNSEGILLIQHQLETSKGENTYIDFLMMAEEDTEPTGRDNCAADSSTRNASEIAYSREEKRSAGVDSDDDGFNDFR